MFPSSPPRTPSKRRRSYPHNDYPNKRSKMRKPIEEASAETSRSHPHTRKVSKREIKFQKKVLAAVNGKEPGGKYVVERQITLCAKTFGQATSYSTDDSGCRLEIFTPGHYKDALEVLYGTKAIVTAGYSTRTGEIFEIDTPLTVTHAKCRLNFKNNSQHVTWVEMYKFTAKDRAHNYAPEMTAYNNSDYIDAPTGAGRNIQAIMNTSYPNWSVKDNPQILDDYEVELTKIRFDPGEKYTHIFNGAFGTMDLQKKITPGNIPGPTCTLESSFRKGCGSHLWFRVWCEAALVVGTTGTVSNSNTGLFSTIAEPTHKLATTGVTGVQVEMLTTIGVKPITGGTEYQGIRERPVFYHHSFATANPTGTLTWTDVDHAAPQSIGATDV